MIIADTDGLFSTISKYYPKQCPFSSKEYITSQEYLRYVDVVMDLSERSIKEKQLFSLLSECLDGYHIVLREHSNYQNYPSIHFTLLLHKNRQILDDDVDLIVSLNGKRIDLEIFFSLLGDYYYCCIVETKGWSNSTNWVFSSLAEEQLPEEERLLIKTICSKVTPLGQNRVTQRLAHIIVPEIETELLNRGNATIFNCLFTDMITRYY